MTQVAALSLALNFLEKHVSPAPGQDPLSQTILDKINYP